MDHSHQVCRENERQLRESVERVEKEVERLRQRIDRALSLKGIHGPSTKIREVLRGDLDTASSASRQYWIESGRYLTHDEVEDYEDEPWDDPALD